MVRKVVIVAAALFLPTPACMSPGNHRSPVTAYDDLPALDIDDALALAREAATSEYAAELYAIDRCERQPDGWWIDFAPRSLDEVGAGWSHTEKERWLALGNHFSVYVYNDRTTRLIRGK